ncbi:hypothetical protein JW865_06280 [Candidatus Bathyarchaeota archaeon]|nr:hypothetical protein [Candidatus Bathyarchaeota archaeon]
MTEKKENSIWDKLGLIDYRIIYATFIILLATPVIYPLGLPMTVSQPVRSYYDAIVNLPPNSVILMHSFVDLSVWADTGPILIATWKIIWDIPQSKNISIIAYTSVNDGAIKMDDLLKGELKPPQWRIDSYGYTWMDIGYISLPNEPMLAAFAADFTAVSRDDHHIYDIGSEFAGSPLLDVPLAKWVASRRGDPNVLNAYDFDLYIYGSWGCTTPDMYVRQWWTTGSPSYELKALFMTIGNCIPNTVPYYGPNNAILGYVPGSAGAAALEILSGHLGKGAVMADMANLAGIGTVFFLVLGNLSYLGKKYFEKKEEE